MLSQHHHQRRPEWEWYGIHMDANVLKHEHTHIHALTYVRTNVNECWVFLKQGRKAVILWNSHHFFKQPKFFILKWFLRKRQERGKGGKSVTNIYENNLNVRLRIGARFRKKANSQSEPKKIVTFHSHAQMYCFSTEKERKDERG